MIEYVELKDSSDNIAKFQVRFKKDKLKEVTNTYISRIFKIEIVMDMDVSNDIFICLKVNEPQKLKKMGIAIEDIRKCMDDAGYVRILDDKVINILEDRELRRQLDIEDMKSRVNNFESSPEWEKYINLNSYREMAEKYGRTQNWMNFGRRICRNDFMKSYLRDKFKNTCPICNKVLYGKWNIHHINYNRECIYSETVKQHRSSGPDCEKCYVEHNDEFNKCVSMLAPVHSLCNKVVSVSFNSDV